MIVLGLVLLVLAAVLAVGIVVSNPAVLDLSLFVAQVPVTLAGVFFTGAVTMLVVVLAVVLIQRGIARSRRLRRERKALPRPVRSAETPDVAAPPTPSPAPTKTAPSPAATPAKSPAAGPAPGSGRQVEAVRSVDPDHSGASTPAERAALLAESDQLTRDDPAR